MGKLLSLLNLLTLLTGAIGAIAQAEPSLAQAESVGKTPTPETEPASEEISMGAWEQPETKEQWHSQLSEPIEITEIQIQNAEIGLEIVLVTATETFPFPPAEIVGNSLIAEIPNAVLRLPEGEAFLISEPGKGIAQIEVSNLPNNRVQIAITGIDAPPTANPLDSAEGLTLSVTPGVTAGEATDVIVVGEQKEDYYVPEASTATRTDTPLRDVPQSIQVIPRRVIEEQQAVRLGDALRNASGVVNSTNDPRGQQFAIRGFDASSILRDGFRLNGNDGFQELANVERIEVLKGPASILFGSLEPGGIINLVSKQPLSEPFYEIGFRVGNRGLIEPSFDFSGPLSEDGRVLYRLNLLYRNEQSFRDFDADIERFFVAPVVSVKISDRTDLTLDLEYRRDRRPADFGLVAIGDRVVDVPLSRITGEPDDFYRADFLRTGYQFEHHFSGNWKLRNAFHFTRLNPGEFISANPFRVDEATGTLFRAFAFLAQPNDRYELQTNVVGEFSTGSIDHKLLVGVDWVRDEGEAVFQADFANITPFNIFNPVFGVLTRPDFATVPLALEGEFQTDRLGIYLQDQITLFDNLKLLAGIRYDTVERESIDNLTSSTTTQNDNAFSPRIGIVYQPIEEISLFASYSRSFVPNSSTTATGDFLEPERGEQIEVGVKAEFLDGQLGANLAYFDITKENVATSDPNNRFFSIAVGEQRSQGIELDLIGEPLPGWNLVANYAYTDARITKDNSGLVGNRLFDVPEHNFNFWTSYVIQSGSLEGLGLGIGFNYLGDRFGDNANSFELGSYFLTNAALSYRRDNWQVGLNVRNLFDVNYIDGAENNRRSEIYPGEGFTAIASFSIEF